MNNLTKALLASAGLMAFLSAGHVSHVFAAEPAYRCRLSVGAEYIDGEPGDYSTESVDVWFTSVTPYLGSEKPVKDIRGSLTISRPQQADVILPFNEGNGDRGNGVIRLSLLGDKLLIFFNERDRKVFLYRHHQQSFRPTKVLASCDNGGGRVINYVVENQRTDGSDLEMDIVCLSYLGFCSGAHPIVRGGGIAYGAFGANSGTDIIQAKFRVSPDTYSPCLTKQLFPLLRNTGGFLVSVIGTGTQESPYVSCQLTSF